MNNEKNLHNTPDPHKDGNRQNTGNRPTVPTSDEARPSTAGDTANGKGSGTGLRKDDKERNDNYDTERAS